MSLRDTYSHEKCTCFVGPIPQKIIGNKIFSIHFITKLFVLKEFFGCFVAFSNRVYNGCMPRVLIVLFIRVIVTRVLVYCLNL